MSNYSDEKNSYSCIKNCGSDGSECPLSVQAQCRAMAEAFSFGFLAAEKDLGWHRNCAETPVPQLTIDAVFYYEKTVRRTDMLRYHEKTGFYYSGYYEKWIKPEDITHWRKIPDSIES